MCGRIRVKLLILAGLWSFSVTQVEGMLKVLDDSVEFAEAKPSFTLISKLLGIRKGEEPREAPMQSLLKYEARLRQHNAENVLKRVVEGEDGRKQVTSTTRYPYSCFCHLNSVLDGDSYVGSGVLIGSHHILTCAHNVYNLDKNRWVDECSAYCGLNGTNAPYGRCGVVRCYVPEEYTRDRDIQFDIALIVIDRPMGLKVGYLGCLFSTDIKMFEEDLNLTGYPGDKGGTTMWTMANKAKAISGELIFYDIDTYGGQSGSPVWSRFGLDDEGEVEKKMWPLVVGVHTHGESVQGSGNSGTRLTEYKFKLIMNWMAQTGQLVVQLNKSPLVPAKKPVLAARRPLPVGPAAVKATAKTQVAPLPTSPVDYDPRINEVDEEGKTALHRAVISGNVEVVKALILRWADVKAADKYGRTPLHWACENGNREIAELLLDNRADVKALCGQGKSSLYYACLPEKFNEENKPNKELVELLFARGVSIDDPGCFQHGKNLLQGVCLDNKIELVFILIAHGASLGVLTSEGQSLVHLVCNRCAAKDDIVLLQFLLDKGLDVNAVDSKGYTPLHNLADRFISLNPLLLGIGASMTDEATIKATIREAAELLIKRGADVNRSSKPYSKEKRAGIFHSLVGTDYVKVKRGGKPPVHLAVAKGNKALVEVLLKYGADPYLKNAKGNTAFDYTKDEEIKALMKKQASQKSTRLFGKK